MAEGAHEPRQILGTYHDDRDNRDNQELSPTDAEHEGDLGHADSQEPARLSFRPNFRLRAPSGRPGGLVSW